MLLRNLIPAFLLILPLLATTSLAAAPPALVPLPAEVEWKSGQCKLGSWIATDGACKAEANELAAMLRPATGIDFKVHSMGSELENFGPKIRLKVDQSLASTSKEAYRLSVQREEISISAHRRPACFYGMQTLRQLLPVQVFASAKQSGVEWKVPCCEIVDQPRFAWRGFMLDDSRHFLGAEYVKRLIDLMAMHKLNLLHWHLSDDDGFRVEIKSYPKLTEVGGWRGTECKLPNTRPGERHARYGGFYTQEQIRDIVAYASARHIDIMPEIDIPGHSGAAAVAYPGEILCEGKTKGTTSGAPDAKRTTRCWTRWVDELAKLSPSSTSLHRRRRSGPPLQPGARLPALHPARPLMEREKIASLGQIQAYFTRRYDEILHKHGRKMIGWNEILNDKLPKDSAIMAWQNDVPGYKAASGGWNAVFAPGQHCYLDMKESRDDTWGMTWAGIVPLSAVYNYDPLARPGLTDEQIARVLGVHACLWTEFITSNERGDYKTWPRLCALAEVGWTPQPRRNFAEFMDRLGPAHLERLGLLGVAYRVPDPEVKLAAEGGPTVVGATGPVGKAKVKGGVFEIRPPFAGAEIHYTTDGSEPLQTSPRWTGDLILVEGLRPLAARTFLPGGRTSHAVTVPAVKK